MEAPLERQEGGSWCYVVVFMRKEREGRSASWFFVSGSGNGLVNFFLVVYNQRAGPTCTNFY
jgi:hypothetical protein